MLYIDLNRARREMRKDDMDAFIALSPSNFYYVTGFQHRMSSMLPALVLVPASAGLERAIIISKIDEVPVRRVCDIVSVRSYPTWQENVNIKDIVGGQGRITPKPVRPRWEGIFALLSDVLRERGLQEGKIGVEMDYIPEHAYRLLLEYNHEAEFVDARRVFDDLQAIKSKDEVTIISTAARATRKGIQAVVNGQVIGATIGELRLRYEMGVLEEMAEEVDANAFETAQVLISAGASFHNLGSSRYRLAKGDNLCINCRATISGYSATMGRTFIVRKPSTLQTKVYGVLQRAYEEALSRMRPGARIMSITTFFEPPLTTYFDPPG